MKYPFIGGIDDDCKVLLIENGYGIAIEHPTIEITGVPERGWNNSSFKNITQEYLANTYGKVANKEHAEFIVGLCKVNGIDFLDDYEGGVMWFNCKCGLLDFYIDKNTASNDGEKLITIPLPPKQIQTATSEEEFEMKQIMKNNGDNLILGCEDSKCEWPQIGDEVIIFNQHNELRGELLALTKEYAIISQHYGEQHLHLSGCKFKKPKTPEEELRDDIVQTIHDDVYHGAYEKQPLVVFADALMTKYNITKKPQ